MKYFNFAAAIVAFIWFCFIVRFDFINTYYELIAGACTAWTLGVSVGKGVEG